METEGIIIGLIIGCFLIEGTVVAFFPIAEQTDKAYAQVQFENWLEKAGNKTWRAECESNMEITRIENSITYFRYAKDNGCATGYYRPLEDSIYVQDGRAEKQMERTICHEKIHQRHYKEGIYKADKDGNWDYAEEERRTLVEVEEECQ